MERDGLAAYISSFDIALQPEVTAYASPLKLFEYMALSRAIIAPDAPNIREILTHEVDALLFEPDNPKSLASAIRTLVAGCAACGRGWGGGGADKIHRGGYFLGAQCPPGDVAGPGQPGERSA